MPLVKCINGHTGCAAAERYLERDGRAIGHDFVNLDCMERGGLIGWAAEMDELRALHGNGEPYRGKPAVTYRHYIVSPDPADKIDLETLRELTCSWTRKHFGGYQVAIVYHDDNEHHIPHAHVVVNNTNVETGRRLHVPDPKGLNRDLQQMARERGLGYFAEKHPLYRDHRAKGSELRTDQLEYKGRAERRIEREGGYSWVADIRQRARIARALSRGEGDYRALLGAMGVELSLNSPNARRCDYLYALADHPSRKVGGEKLGRPYGKSELEWEWFRSSALKGEGLGQIVEGAISLGGLDELRALARTMETIRDSRFSSIADIDWEINRLERSAESADGPENRADISERLERTRQARSFVADHDLLPAKTPKPAYERKPRSFDEPRHHHYSGSDHSSHPQQSISHDRGGYAR